MEKIPMLFLLLYGIPESMVLISLSSALYGYDVKRNLIRILLLSLSFVVIIYVVRSLPIKFGLNIVIQIPFYIVLTTYFLKVTFRKSLFIILTYYIIVLLAENTLYPLIITLTGRELSTIFSNEWSRLIVGWCLLLVLLIPTVFIIKKQYTFAMAISFFKPTNLNAKITLMATIVLVQALLAGLLQMASIFEEYSVFPVAFNSETLKKIIGTALITIPIVSIFFIKRLFDLSQQEAITATQEAFLDSINNLFVTVRGQRHDFINHVQVIYSMLKANQTNEAIKYMDNLLDDIQEVNDVIKTKDPALSALLNTKAAVANRHNISFETESGTSIESLNVKSLDLVKILGNLLDNAVEAVMNQPPEFRKIKLSIKRYHNVFVFEVSNPRPVIPRDQLENIFTAGFTTKKDIGHSGLGLAIVKEIVEKYNGQIGVKSTEKEGTIFTVVIPG